MLIAIEPQHVMQIARRIAVEILNRQPFFAIGDSFERDLSSAVASARRAASDLDIHRFVRIVVEFESVSAPIVEVKDQPVMIGSIGEIDRATYPNTVRIIFVSPATIEVNTAV